MVPIEVNRWCVTIACAEPERWVREAPALEDDPDFAEFGLKLDLYYEVDEPRVLWALRARTGMLVYAPEADIRAAIDRLY